MIEYELRHDFENISIYTSSSPNAPLYLPRRSMGIRVIRLVTRWIVRVWEMAGPPVVSEVFHIIGFSAVQSFLLQTWKKDDGDREQSMIEFRGVLTGGGPGLSMRKEFLVMKFILHQTQKWGKKITSGKFVVETLRWNSQKMPKMRHLLLLDALWDFGTKIQMVLRKFEVHENFCKSASASSCGCRVFWFSISV